MKNILNALWIKSAKASGDCEIYYTKEFRSDKELVSASLEATALGVYTVHIIPCCRMESASSSRASSRKIFRGCAGLGRIARAGRNITLPVSI